MGDHEISLPHALIHCEKLLATHCGNGFTCGAQVKTIFGLRLQCVVVFPVMVIYICKALQWMKRCTFQTHYRNACIFNKLFDEQFAVIIFPVFQRRKCSDSKNVKIFSKNQALHLLHVQLYCRS